MEYNNIIGENFSPFKGLPWFDQASLTEATIGGAGGIGSWLSFFLNRAGIRVYVIDFDNLEERNLGGQFFMKESVGLSKVKALNNALSKFAPLSNCNFINGRIQDYGVHRYSFSAFDNMEARKIMFRKWKNDLSSLPVSERYKPIFIDGRLEAEFFQIYCVTPNRIEQYEETLFDDDSIAEVACTVKQTSHVAAMIGAYMTSFFTNHLTNIAEKSKVREVPFKFEVFLPLVLAYES